MQLSSESITNGQPIAATFAAGNAEGFAPNRNPQLAWHDVPAGTRSFALLCIDPDVPTVPETVGREDCTVPRDQPRAHFVHWAMADIPADVRELAAGSCSDGFTVRGKTQPAGPAGSRQGLNDFTGWFAGNPDMAGQYLGYDGPYPPFNDERVHRYFFRVRAGRGAAGAAHAVHRRGCVACDARARAGRSLAAWHLHIESGAGLR